jgi:hypothetical protein
LGIRVTIGERDHHSIPTEQILDTEARLWTLLSASLANGILLLCSSAGSVPRKSINCIAMAMAKHPMYSVPRIESLGNKKSRRGEKPPSQLIAPESQQMNAPVRLHLISSDSPGDHAVAGAEL